MEAEPLETGAEIARESAGRERDVAIARAAPKGLERIELALGRVGLADAGQEEPGEVVEVAELAVVDRAEQAVEDEQVEFLDLRMSAVIASMIERTDWRRGSAMLCRLSSAMTPTRAARIVQMNAVASDLRLPRMSVRRSTR